MKAIKVLGSIGCWACIVAACIFYGVKAGALVALALLLEAIIAGVMIVETENECRCAGCDELLRDMEDDGK